MFGGLGLGLAISKALAEVHQGELTAASAGRGRCATFTLTLPTITVASTTSADTSPRATKSGPAPDSPHEGLNAAMPTSGDSTAMLSPSCAPSASSSSATNPKARILLVEDHPDTSRIMARLLERDGYCVEVATSVAAALD